MRAIIIWVLKKKCTIEHLEKISLFSISFYVDCNSGPIDKLKRKLLDNAFNTTEPQKKMPAKVNQQNTVDDLGNDDPNKLINYNDAYKYWKSVPATVGGVLGGFGEETVVPTKDIVGSATFLRKLSSRMRPNKSQGEVKYGIELGAGIGRVTKKLLYKYCDKVDLLEYNEDFVKQMEVVLKDLKQEGKIGDIYTTGMQDFFTKNGNAGVYEEGRKYWLVWCQWCLNYLPDNELIEFLRKFGESLSENGTIIVKENIVSNINDEDVFDEIDSSVTRTDSKFKYIFRKSGLKLIAQDFQKGLPEELYPVKMYALKRDLN